MERHALKADLHWDLSKKGVSKRRHAGFDSAEGERLAPELAREIGAGFASGLRHFS